MGKEQQLHFTTLAIPKSTSFTYPYEIGVNVRILLLGLVEVMVSTMML